MAEEKYSMSGYNLGAAASEILGIGNKLLAIKSLAVTAETKSVLKDIQTDYKVLENVLKKVTEEAASLLLSQVLEIIKRDYKAIMYVVEGQTVSPNDEIREAAEEIKKSLKLLGEIFVGKENKQLGNVNGEVALLKKIDISKYQLLSVDSIFNRLNDNVEFYSTKFGNIVQDRVKKSQDTKLSIARNALVEDFKDLRKCLEYVQSSKEKRGKDDNFIKQANDIWLKARVGQEATRRNKGKSDKIIN